MSLHSPPNGRGSWWTRAERIAAGMPVCATPDCDRAPTVGRRGRCRRCYESDPAVQHKRDGRGGPRVLRDPVQFLTLLERAQRDQVKARAEELRVSASEVVRRALTRELGSP